MVSNQVRWQIHHRGVSVKRNSQWIILLLVLLALCATGCAWSNRVNVIKNGDVLPDQKTIMTPPGTGGMIGIVKQVLSEKQWKMVALKGPARTTGRIGESGVDISQYTEATAGYILYLNSEFFGYRNCNPNFNSYAGVPLTASYRYSVSIVDWKTGVEVVTIGGQGCLYDILPNFRDNIP